MGERSTILLFVALFLFSLILFVLDRWGLMSAVRGMTEGLLSRTYQVRDTTFLLPFFANERIQELEEENRTLLEKLALLEALKKENENLRLQLGIAGSRDRAPKIMLANVVSTSRHFIIDKGEEDGVRVGNTVVFKNIFIGKVEKVGERVSRVLLPKERGSEIEVELTKTSARGNVRGQGSKALLSLVTLAEKLEEGDVLKTVGNVDEEGLGVRPNLLVGSIEHVRRTSDQLFQEADVVPLINYEDLQNVFVVL